MNLLALVSPKITAALVLLAAASVAGNALQYFSARAAAAECATAAAERRASLADAVVSAAQAFTATAQALAIDSAEADQRRAATLDAATQRIARAAGSYAAAAKAQPMNPDCRLSPERAAAINAARGYKP